MSLVEKFFGNVTHEPEGMRHEQPAINNEAEQKAREAEATNEEFLNHFKEILESSDMSEYAKLLGELHITKDPMRPNSRARFMHFGLSEAVDDETFKDIEKTLVQIKRDRVASKKRNEAGDKDITVKLYQPDEIPDFSETILNDQPEQTEFVPKDDLTSEQSASSLEETLTEVPEPDSADPLTNPAETSGEVNNTPEQIADNNFELTETIKKLNDDNEELTNKINELIKERDLFKDDLEKTEQRLTELQDLLKEAETSSEHEKGYADKLANEYGDLETKVRELTDKLAVAHNKIKELDNEKFSLAAKERDLRDDNAQLQKKLDELQNDNADLKKRSIDTSSDIQEAEAANATEIARQFETIQKLQKKIESLSSELTESRKMITDYEEVLPNVRIVLRQIEAELPQIEAESGQVKDPRILIEKLISIIDALLASNKL